MNIIDKVLDVCASQIGVTEYPPNSNDVKFNTAYYGREVWDGLWGCTFPWCVTYLWWCFKEAKASKYFYGGEKTANCGTLADYYEANGQLIKHGYKRGDIVFFSFKKDYQHVGIIESVNKDGTYTCLEGNTSNDAWGSQANGGAVCRKIRLLMNICAGARWYNEDDDMDINGLIKLLKDATPEQRKDIGKELDSCVKSYRVGLSFPASMIPELERAKEHGITDGSRPMDYSTRGEVAIMADRAVYGKE